MKADRGEVTLEITDHPSPGDVLFIEEQLSLYNEEQSLLYDKRPLCIFARDDAAKTIGGVTGFTNWGWLYLDCFWLPADQRGKFGLGTRILQAAEAQAVARGCRNARLYTYSFQAPAFYRKHGYTVFGELTDYPLGHSQIWLRKALV